jgi:hypothetical protein
VGQVLRSTDVNGWRPRERDPVQDEVSPVVGERRRMQKEIERLHASARDAQARAKRREEEAVGHVLDFLANSSRRERELEEALTSCTDALTGCVDAISELVGIPLCGEPEAQARWRECLEAAWQARSRALEQLPKRQPLDLLTRQP